ncbi:MAG: 2OG-Fe(II) oxygenase, partial [Ilumatobacteraceae bacterium]
MNGVMSSVFLGLDVEEASREYATTAPFPHAVLHDVIDPDCLAEAIRSFPEVDGPHWTNYLHVNERKFGNARYETWPEPLQRLADQLMSPEFVAFLERLTGISDLQPDPSFDGGGLHRSERGGFLNVHADYSKHHVHADWRRRVNVLLYLNDEWDEAWGGHLELWSADMRTKERAVPPFGNTMIIFSTT